ITLDDQYRIYRVVQPSGVTLDFAELQGKNIQEDLARRDFTVNAMAAPLTPTSPDFRRVAGRLGDLSPSRGEGVRLKGLIDPFDGQRDLKKKIIRGVSEKAFVEDPLRTLRTFRFAAQFGFAIDPRTLNWVRAHRQGLSRVSAERIREELLRLWKQPFTGK